MTEAICKQAKSAAVIIFFSILLRSTQFSNAAVSNMLIFRRRHRAHWHQTVHKYGFTQGSIK